MVPGASIFFIDASVDMATHLSYSGVPVPSMIPGIVLNCLLTSSTIAIAALPTAWMARDEKINGIMPPTNKLASTFAL